MHSAPTATPDRCTSNDYHGRREIPSALDVELAAERDPDLTVHEIAVLGVIARRASGCEGACWLAIPRLAAAAHVGLRTAQRALRRLVEAGWLSELRAPRSSTVYRVRAVRVRTPPRPTGPLFDASFETGAPEEPAPEQLRARVSQRHPEGATAAPDQTRDQINQIPPDPPEGGGSPESPEEEIDPLSYPDGDTLDPFVLLELEAVAARKAPATEQPRLLGATSLEGGDTPPPLEQRRAVVESLAERMLAELEETPDRELAVVLEAYRCGSAWLVDRWITLARGHRTVDGTVRRGWDAPDGVRRRYVTRALTVARDRWVALHPSRVRR